MDAIPPNANVAVSIERLMQSSRAGSRDDLWELVNIARVRPLSTIHASDLLETFCFIVANVEKSQDFDGALGTTFASFRGLDLLRTRYGSRSTFRNSFAKAFFKCWLPFSLWLSATTAENAFYDRDASDRLRFVRIMKSSFSIASQLPTWTSSTIDWSHIARLTSRVWLRLKGPTAGELCCLHDILLLVPGRFPAEIIVEDSERNGMKVVALVKLIVRRLQRLRRRLDDMAVPSIAGDSSTFERLCGALSSVNAVINALIRDGEPFLRSSPETKDPLIRVVDESLCLVGLILNNELSYQHSCALRAVESSFVAVRVLLEDLPDVCAMQEALKKGLMPMLIKASQRSAELQKDGTDALIYILSKILPRNLIFRSVLILVRKTLNQSTNGDAIVMVLDAPILNAAWNFFFGLLSHFSASFAYLEKKRRSEMFSCGNDACSVVGLRGSFKVASWASHKAICSATICPLLSSSDVWFLVENSCDEVRRILPEFSRNPSPGVAHIPLQDRGFVVKFSKVGDGCEMGQMDRSKLLGIIGRGVPVVNAVRDGSCEFSPASKYVSTVILVSFHVGFERRRLVFNVAFTESALEGKDCSCCLFHGEPVNEGLRCRIH
ncbi:hypothetical protein SCHPADRAFT_946327 [Schizopora paradoxa]|uniref:Uncharacterized protein n=1 Tax=Schizopora paradoxa TaxID=27342 RepID=A0A0H2RMU4_9AGAM|nr:hypothetical protein SCHPADRAFT_946327 [Schizopora paradoxa]